MNPKATNPLIKSTTRFNRLALAVSLLWTSAFGSVVLMTIASGGPAGNNGTIKVDRSPFDSHPNNEPHVDCAFQIDFYGYDKGNLWADVVFEQQPPTDGGQMNVIGKKRVFIGSDDNSGGGSIAGLDATEDYRLEFSGLNPHPEQGYHVKLTIHAAGSQGADVKHKVFWVEPCGSDGPPTPTPTATVKPTVTPATGGNTPTPRPGNPTPTATVNPSATPTPTPTPGGAGGTTPTPTPTATPVPVGGAGSPTPAAGGSTPTPAVGGANESTGSGAATQHTPIPAGAIVTGNIPNWSAPVDLGAVRLPNVGSALLLFGILLAVIPANLILIIWAIRRQMEDRRMLDQLMAGDGPSDKNL